MCYVFKYAGHRARIMVRIANTITGVLRQIGFLPVVRIMLMKAEALIESETNTLKLSG
jgi:hypothetical protein